MAIPVSTVPAVVAYLATAIQKQYAVDPLAGSILLTIGDPGSDLPPDIIKIGEVRRTLVPRTSIGSGAQYWLNETYDVECVVSTWTGDGPNDGSTTVPNALNARAWQLLGYVEAAVRTDPSLGELVNQAFPQGATSVGPEWTDSASGMSVEVTVQIHVEVLN